MKRTVTIMVGAAALGALVYLGGRLAAQQGAGQPYTPPRTKVALLNLNQVIKKYKRTESLQAEFKHEYEKYDLLIQPKKKQIETDQLEGQNPATTAARRDQISKDLVRLQREIQDVSEDAKKKLGDKQAEQMKLLYSEVKMAVDAYAKARDVELVFTYNDVFADDPSNPMSVPRKLTTEACLPMYVTPGMDITADVIQMLNTWYEQSVPKTTAQAPGGQH